VSENLNQSGKVFDEVSDLKTSLPKVVYDVAESQLVSGKVFDEVSGCRT